MSETLDRLKHLELNAKRAALGGLLLRCTGEQTTTFEKFYGRVDSIPENKLNAAILLCERTIAKNKG